MGFKIPLIKPTVGAEELEAVSKVFESGWLTQGPETLAFEREFAEYVGSKYAISTTSCTTALHLAMVCCGIKAGDEVIVPDFTFGATANAVVQCGATPVLCDIRLDEFQIDPDSVRKLITEKTKAIVPVNEFGLTADMKEIMEIARLEYDLKVIEDSAPALGSKRWNRHAGTFGDMGCFSFHPRKLCAIGEGGMIVTDNKELAELAQTLKNHGQGGKFQYTHNGFNYRLSNVQAAIGRVQLNKFKEALPRRLELAKFYNDILKDKDCCIPYVPYDTFHTYQSYVIRLPKSSQLAIERIRNRGIAEVQIGTSCLHMYPAFSSFPRDDLTNSFLAWNNGIAIPLYDGMTEGEQCQVLVELLKEI